MSKKIGYKKVAGKPLFMVFGILSFLAFAVTALIPTLIRQGMGIPFQFHRWGAYLALLLMALHAILRKV